MMPLPWVAGAPTAWRLDLQARGSIWDSGVGSAKVGGRWNPVGNPVVYCSADPATAIVEVVVHKGFAVLDAVPHVLTRARILEVTDVHVVMPDDVPNAAWLTPGRRATDNNRSGARCCKSTRSSSSRVRSPARAGTSCSTLLVQRDDTSWKLRSDSRSTRVSIRPLVRHGDELLKLPRASKPCARRSSGPR